MNKFTNLEEATIILLKSMMVIINLSAPMLIIGQFGLADDQVSLMRYHHQATMIQLMI